MQNYTTIIGVIELRSKRCSYDTVQKRYSIGSGTVTLIMNRFKEIGLTLEDLQQMEPIKVENALLPKGQSSAQRHPYA
jgi:transposase